MKKYWELDPTKVQVEIEDKKHLDELFKICELFGLEIDVNDYDKSTEWFMFYEWSFSDYGYKEEFTEVTTEQFYEILCHNYGYQGELKGFDKDVVLRMLEYLEEQGYRRSIKIFEYSYFGGFDWSETEEGYDFWEDTITINKGKFPKEEALEVKETREYYFNSSKHGDNFYYIVKKLPVKNEFHDWKDYYLYKQCGTGLEFLKPVDMFNNEFKKVYAV